MIEIHLNQNEDTYPLPTIRDLVNLATEIQREAEILANEISKRQAFTASRSLSLMSRDFDLLRKQFRQVTGLSFREEIQD